MRLQASYGEEMNSLNNVLFEEFKSLDKLCGELYNEQYGVTHYINDMEAVSLYDYRNIPNWKADLQSLKHVRHIRNNLAHAEGSFNEENCTQYDIDWIKDFRNRILNQTDPIAILYQNTKTKEQALKHLKTDNNADNNSNDKKNIQANEQTGVQINMYINSETSKQVNDAAGNQINVQVYEEKRSFKISQAMPVLITIILCIILIVLCMKAVF